MADELFEAILRGDVAGIEKALDAGADIEAMQADTPGWRPLHVAIEAIDEEGAPLDVLRILLERGADVSAWDRRRDSTPVLLAACRAQPDSVRLLLEHGADPNITGGEGDTAIRWAAEEGDIALVDILLTHGVKSSIDTPGTTEGTTPLGAAAQRGHIEIVERLLAAGADPLVEDWDGFTAEECARFDLEDASGELAARLQAVIERLQAAAREAASGADA